MKRRLIKLGLFLIAGAIVNVVVAWGRSVPSSVVVETRDRLVNEDDIAWWRKRASAGFADAPVGVSEFFGFARFTLFMHEEEWSGNNRSLGNNCFRSMHGWPMLCLERDSWVDRKAWKVYDNSSLTLPKPWPFPTSRTVRLPTRPILIGVLVNSVFYAVAIALTVHVLAAVRRWRRIKHGLCPACAYPIGQSPICTECGGPVK